jgi:hypothetical protein
MQTPWCLFPALLCAAVLPLTAARADRPLKDPPKALITKEARQAADAGLAYLAKQQHEDGSWGTGAFKGNVGITGLAGLAFLTAGQQPGLGPIGDTLNSAVDYILSKESKDIRGFFPGGGPTHGPMYGHGYATLFLAEVHGALADKARKKRVKEALGRAVKLIVSAQNREGGWRYQPRPLEADVTLTACQLHALCAARDAGIEVPREALDRGRHYILSCQDLRGDGGFRYMRQGGPTGFARTAAAVSALNRAGMGNRDELEKGLKYLRSKKPNGKPDVAMQIHYYYGYYYAAQAFRQAAARDWPDWYAAIRDKLLRPQGDRRDDGSWNDKRICPHYCTAMAVLILQSPGSPIKAPGPVKKAQTDPAEEPAPEALAKLIAQLGAARFRTRQEASAELEKLGRPVLGALRKAATANADLEVRRRIEAVATRIEAASVKNWVKPYCLKNGLRWDQLEACQSALAPQGRVFRYILPAVQAQGNQRELAERYAVVLVDPASGNIYDVKRIPGGDRTLDQRTWAILRLMGTKVADSKHAEAVMRDLGRIGRWLDTAHSDNDTGTVHVVQVTKGKSWIEPATTYHADTSGGFRVVMTVDDDGYVTGFHVGPIR